MEEELRKRLAFHFMDPVDKFIARRQVPWKLLLQFLKGTLIQIIVYNISENWLLNKMFNLLIIHLLNNFSYISYCSTSCFWVLSICTFQLLQRQSNRLLPSVLGRCMGSSSRNWCVSSIYWCFGIIWKGIT